VSATYRDTRAVLTIASDLNTSAQASRWVAGTEEAGHDDVRGMMMEGERSISFKAIDGCK